MEEREFFDRLLSRVRYATPEEKAGIRRELADHLTDHADALQKGGYGEALARQRAMEAMGEPEEIGRALNRCYPLGWLVLSRAAPAVTALLCAVFLFTWPLLGNVLSSLEARLCPERTAVTSSDQSGYTMHPADIRVRIGTDVLRIYQVGVREESDGTVTAAITACNYDRFPFGVASQSLLDALRLETAQEPESVWENRLLGGGRSNAGAAYLAAGGLPVEPGADSLTLLYAAYGERLRIAVPLPEEGNP